MKKAEKFRSFLASVLILALLACLTSCFDLGMFEDGEEEGYADYYAAFDDIVAVTAEDSYEYDMARSLFNEETVNHLTWEDDDDAVRQEPYIYIGIPCERDMKIEEINLYVKGDVDTTATVYVFVLDGVGDIPSSPCAFDEDPDATVEDDDEDEEESAYDDLDLSFAVTHRECSFVKDKFKGIYFDFGSKNPIVLKDGQSLVFYVFDNTGYGKREGRRCVSFSFLNLMIRAVE